jgi:hypothetical protein
VDVEGTSHSTTLRVKLRSSNKTIGDNPDFAESAEHNGTAPFSKTVLLESLQNHVIEAPLASEINTMAIRKSKKQLSTKQQTEMLRTLRTRFEQNMNRHKGVAWEKVESRLTANPEKLWSLNEMERTGGEPDVVGHDKKSGKFIFFDCSEQSPSGRRSIAYDREGQKANIKGRPDAKNNAVDMAAAMGIEILSEQETHELQKLGEFDTKSSSWIATPPDIRELGGALFSERRYGHVFICPNGAQSYYSARGFRGSLRV